MRKWCAGLAGVLLSGLMFCNPSAWGDTPSVRFDAENKLYRPEGWRQWVFIGAQVTPNDMNGGQAYLPEVHYVYIDPESFEHWKKT